ncbi:MAG: hypothetical protein LBN02_10560 [Oscillospiraceae bacterium]|jgi:hypothetical protein|nr:hypothetical protein [Oscillospiraceae bacterium]
MRKLEELDIRCDHCRYGSRLSGGEIICAKRGVLPPHFHCARFRYDLTKRVPEPKPRIDTSKYKEKLNVEDL